VITITYPCDNCTDDTCSDEGCALYLTAVQTHAAAARLARVVRESALPSAERQRIAVIFADALVEALGLCSARMDRGSFMAYCGLEVRT